MILWSLQGEWTGYCIVCWRGERGAVGRAGPVPDCAGPQTGGLHQSMWPDEIPHVSAIPALNQTWPSARFLCPSVMPVNVTNPLRRVVE